MSDIVELLRGDIPERVIEDHWTIDFDELDKQREEAANEIEQNRIDLEEYRLDVERLRAALELFECDCEGEELCFNTDNCRNFIARTALSGDK
jgi:hypothetical protein